jgi:hypothetical protein
VFTATVVQANAVPSISEMNSRRFNDQNCIPHPLVARPDFRISNW